MAIKRIYSDLNNIESLKSCGIFVYANEDDITKIDAIIEGPIDTPYQGGYFYFKLKFPNDYPLTSPKVLLQTTGGGTVRFNPNLYSCGKVCLSILGTWEGPSWTAGLTLSTVLLSIQSLMCENPMKNEPGFNHHNNQRELDAYNTIIRHETLRVAAFSNVKKILNGISEIPTELHWGILEGFQKHVSNGYYQKVCQQYQSLDGQVMADPFGENRGKYSFSNLLKEYHLLASTQCCSTPVTSISSNSNTTQNISEVIDITDEDNRKISSNDDISKKQNDFENDSMEQQQEQQQNCNIEEEIEVSEGLKCGICYEVLATAAVLECGHTFCYLCAHKWLMKKSICPTCRESCKLENLRRIFNLDSLSEKEAQRVCKGSNERYANWISRKDEGIELANGKRLKNKKSKKSHSYHYSSYYGEDDDDDGENMELQDEDDSDDEYNNFGNSPSHYQPYSNKEQNYFQMFGGNGHVLGKAETFNSTIPLTEEEEIQQIIRMIDSETNKNIHDIPSFSYSTITSSSTTSKMTPQQIQELRLKKFSASSPSSSSSSTFLPSSSNSENLSTKPTTAATTTTTTTTFNNHSSIPLPSPPLTEAETAYIKAQKEKQERELERKRLRLEIARDKEERKQHAGVLPITHEINLFTKSDTSTLATILQSTNNSTQVTNSTSSSSSSSLSNCPKLLDPTTRLERIETALETIVQFGGNNPTKISYNETKTALTILLKIFENIMNDPNNTKFRSINTSSKIFKEKLMRVEGIQIFLYSCGFTKVVTSDPNGIKQINYTLNDEFYDQRLVEEIQTKLFLAKERFQ